MVVRKDDLNGQDKRKVLEYFVENDDALGLLLDFISSKHMGTYEQHHAAYEIGDKAQFS